MLKSTISWIGPCLGSNRGQRLKGKEYTYDPNQRRGQPVCKGPAKLNENIFFYLVPPINNLPQRGKN